MSANLKNIFGKWGFFACLLFFSILVIRYQWQLLTYIEWADETETIVTVKMILNGSRLYSQIHNLHGPLTFLPGILVEQFGNFSIPGHRISIVVLEWLAFLSIYFCPLLKSHFWRLINASIVATISLLYFPDIFGHTYIYQVIAGLLLIIILTQYCLPAIIEPSNLNLSRILLGNFLIACLPFLAITYIPISLCLFFASLRKSFIKQAIFSVLASFIFNIIFLLLIGSAIGYLALHFWVNLQVSPLYLDGEVNPIRFLRAVLSGATSDVYRYILFILVILAVSKIASFQAGFPARALLLGLGIVSLLLRGNGFQGLTYLYATLGLYTIFFVGSFQSLPYTNLIASGILIVSALKLGILIPANIEPRQIRNSSEFAELVKKITVKGDKIIAWSVQHYEYLLSDRLPASGNFFFLPWQEPYYRNPKMGITIDSCNDINTVKPKLILLDELTYNGWKWADYGPKCIAPILAKDYVQIPDRPIYVRSDIFKEYLKVSR